MVAQTKAEAGSVAGKPDAAAGKGMRQDAAVHSKAVLDEQATAAAVVDADQAEAAAQVADGRILPTDAPVQSIGELAQVSEPTTTDTTTTAAETTPPPVAEEAAPMSPWVGGAIALLGIGAIVAIADSNDDNDSPAPPAGGPAPAPEPAPAPAPEPAPAPAPGPGPAPAPVPNVPPSSVDKAIATEADGSTVIPPSTFEYVTADGGALTSVRIDAITPTLIPDGDPNFAIDPAAAGHGYELVTVAGGITWEAAKAAAEAKGGYLAVLNTIDESVFLENSFDLGVNTIDPTTNPFGNNNGTWVGASQAPFTAGQGVGDGWTWVDGTLLLADSTLWNGPAPADFTSDELNPTADGLDSVENGEAQYGVIYEESGGLAEGNLYDYGIAGDPLAQPAVAGSVQSRYVIEYNTPNAGPLTLDGAEVLPGAVIAVADLETLAWNSVFNTGGTVSFSVSDGTDFSAAPNTLTFTDPVVAGTSNPVSMLIEDPSTLV